MTTSKIITNDKIKAWAELSRAEGQRLVMTYGCYESLHIGHIRHLRQARQMGDILVVVLSPDGALLGGGSSIPGELRAEALAHLDCVDAVIFESNLRNALDLIRPTVFAAMSDAGESRQNEEAEALCLEFGVAFEQANLLTFDTTQGINRILAGFGEEVREYLGLFRSRFSLSDVEQVLDAMAGLKVAVVGDTIIDEYCFCTPLGTSSKDPILALRYLSHDVFAGGIVAVANHVANFASQVDMFTVLGDQNSHRDFIVERLKPNVRPVFAVQKNSPTVLKRRYIEGYTQNKLFEIYFMEDIGLDADADAAFRATLEQALPDYDVVIVADFGHGAISPATRKLLAQRAPYLALNAQANSGNRGFHTVTKYSRADYISIAEHEVRLEMRDMRGPVRPMIDTLAPRLSCSNFVVTRGKRGSLIRSKSGQHIEVPAFARKIVDRIGAGDAFLSVTAMAAKLNTPPELLCFIGNVVGALAVEILGNQKSIDKASVKDFAATLLG